VIEMPRETRAAASLRFLTGPWFTCLSGAAAAALAFAVAFWLTSPAIAPPGLAALASASVSDAAGLMAAVQTAGLRGAPGVRGAIEALKRIDSERVTIKGWAVDRTAPGSQLTIIAFSGGTRVLTTITSGARSDVAQMLPNGNAQNVSFDASFSCNRGQNLVIVAVTPDNTYSQFRSLACP
jgi:hypothetical protein